MNKKVFKIIHHVDQKSIDEMYADYSPVFILSTGRSGSKFLATLLNHSKNITAFHEPRPTLEYFSNFAFHQQQGEKILINMINAARMEMILEVFIMDKIYVESNQCLTFFAPVIAELFKKSKFVHLIRHPGDFIRSAIRKGFHKNDSIWESGRVRMADKNHWAEMDQIDRLGWLWSTTHNFIEEFKKKLNPQRSKIFKFEDLIKNIKAVRNLEKFIGAEKINKNDIQEIQSKKINELEFHPDEPPTMRKISEYPIYDQWTIEIKQKLKKHVEKQSKIYNYQI